VSIRNEIIRVISDAIKRGLFKKSLREEIYDRLSCDLFTALQFSTYMFRALPRRAKRYFSTMLSLTGEPTLSLVPPGKCQLTDIFESLKLLERIEVSSTSSVLRFGLKDESKPLNLSTCACILAKAELDSENKEGLDEGKKEAVIRPYTPISTNDLIGSFDLLVKNYGADGRMSNHLCTAPIGTMVDFKHIIFNVKLQAPFKPKKIGMIVGGTGITPMIQGLHAILGNKENDKEVSVLYGSRNSSDILGKELLDNWEKSHGDNEKGGKFTVTHVLSHEEEKSDWNGTKGFITKELIKEKFAGPEEGDDVMIFVCGPPIMYDIFCGPRSDTEVTGILKDMGYSAEQVYKF